MSLVAVCSEPAGSPDPAGSLVYRFLDQATGVHVSRCMPTRPLNPYPSRSLTRGADLTTDPELHTRTPRPVPSSGPLLCRPDP